MAKERIEPTIDWDAVDELQLLEVTGKNPALYEEKKPKFIEAVKALFRKMGRSRVYRDQPVAEHLSDATVSGLDSLKALIRTAATREEESRANIQQKLADARLKIAQAKKLEADSRIGQDEPGREQQVDKLLKELLEKAAEEYIERLLSSKRLVEVDIDGETVLLLDTTPD